MLSPEELAAIRRRCEDWRTGRTRVVEDCLRLLHDVDTLRLQLEDVADDASFPQGWTELLVEGVPYPPK